MNRRDVWDKQLPHGVADLFLEGAARKSLIENQFCQAFASWGYTEIIPPTFEYYESLATEAGVQLQEEMYRFFDREGRTLSLRVDLTIPTARIVGTKLYDQPLPQRFYYAANVFRHEEPQAGRRREFSQAGVELVGAATPQADAEILAVAIDALASAGVENVRFDVGHIGFFKALLSQTDLHEEEISELVRVLERKDEISLDRLLDELGLVGEVKEAFALLPRLQGNADVLARAEEAALNAQAEAALSELQATFDLLAACQGTRHVRFNLSQLRGMEYYTGLLFQAFSPGVGFPICSGGRYDNLIGHFGPDMPAIGFAIGVERALLALDRQGQPNVRIGPDVLLSTSSWAEAHSLAREMRKFGLRIELDVLERSDEELLDCARTRGIPRVILWKGNECLLWDGIDQHIRDVETILKDMAQWIP